MVWVRSRVQTITPARAAELLAANSTNRPVSKAVVRGFAEAMRRGEWMVTHQGIAFDTRGVLVDGQHRLAAIIEADRPVELTVFTEVGEGTFDVLDIGKRRSAADVLAIEGEKSSTMLAAMVRAVWLYENRPELNWSGGAAGVSNHQIVQTLERHPKLREYVGVGEQVAGATGMIKSAAGAGSYLVAQANRRADLTAWYDGIIDGAGLVTTRPTAAVSPGDVQHDPPTCRAGAAPPGHPRTRRAVPDRVQRLGHRPADQPTPVHPPRHRADHRQSRLTPAPDSSPGGRRRRRRSPNIERFPTAFAIAALNVMRGD